MTTPGASIGDRLPRYRAGFLARNAALNLAGQLAPAGAAIVALPLLARSYQLDVLGLLTMAWAVLGYFTLLDLGLGRALTQRVASRLGAGDPEGVPLLVWTTSVLLGLVGLAGATFLLAGADWIVSTALRVPAHLIVEARLAIRVLAIGLPFVTLASGLRGLLEAHQRFDLVNLVRLPASALMYLGPAVVLPFSHSLVPAVAVLVVVRVAACLAYGWFAVRVEPGTIQSIGQVHGAWRELVGTGAWLTMANLASTALGVLDRVVIGGIVPVAAVAYYATPQEAVTKALVIPAALSAVMFPVFSAELENDSPRLDDYFRRSVRYTFLLLFPVTLIVAGLAREILTVWLGPGFAAHGTTAMQWFSLGVFVNGLALTPSAYLQARGGAGAVAVLQVVEVPLFVAALAAATARHGLEGAAAVWCLRATADLWCLIGLVRWKTSRPLLRPWRDLVVCLFVGLAFLAVGSTGPLAVRLLVLLALLTLSGIIALRMVDLVERDVMTAAWNKLRHAPGA